MLSFKYFCIKAVKINIVSLGISFTRMEKKKKQRLEMMPLPVKKMTAVFSKLIKIRKTLK